MIQCFVAGNTQPSEPTIPYLFRNQRGRASWAADTRPDGGNGSCLYELNLCMWCYARGQERKVSALHAIEARVKIRRGRGRRGRGQARAARRSSAGGWQQGL